MSARILIVDDEQSVREFFQILLTKEGFDVITASGGEEALGLGNELYLLRPRIHVKELFLSGLVGKQRLMRFVRPFRMQMHLHFLAGVSNQPHDFRQWFLAESGGKQRFDEKHSFEPMVVENLKLQRQAVVSGSCWAVDIPLE